MTERTKGPAVSMRRPPTRGPKDPWTPRTIEFHGYLYKPNPRRPTLDGPAHNVRLHFLYAGGRRTTFITMTFTFTAPRTLWATSPPAPPLTLP